MNVTGKMAETAVSAMSYLAEREGQGLASAAEIAESRGFSAALVGKLMTPLVNAGLVIGVRGRNGGFELAKPAKLISVYEVVKLFETSNRPMRCPLGDDWCGEGPHCPMHDALRALEHEVHKRLKAITFDGFHSMLRKK